MSSDNYSTEKHILITGDPVCDHNLYQGERITACSNSDLGIRIKHVPGGGAFLSELIAHVIPTLKSTGWTSSFGPPVDCGQLDGEFHAFCYWEPFDASPGDAKKEDRVWRATGTGLGYGKHGETYPVIAGTGHDVGCQAGDAPADDCPQIVVIDDAGLGYQTEESMPACLKQRDKGASVPRWVVLKLSGSIEPSRVWEPLVSRRPQNLIVVASASQIRTEDVRLSAGLSWEATVEDLTAEIWSNPALAFLRSARHVIVTFGSDAAFWLDNEEGAAKSLLVFDAAHAEHELEENRGIGRAFGYQSCFTASIVRTLCETEPSALPDLEVALRNGLCAGRKVWELGHGRVYKEDDASEVNPQIGFPFDEIASTVAGDNNPFVTVHLPGRPHARGSWMMLDEWQTYARADSRQRPHTDAAFAVARRGPDVLRQFPVARIGVLRTVDRSEIESLRTIRRLMQDYRKPEPPKKPTKPIKPLCIGIFGPPGAGKSFGVEEISKEVLGPDPVILTFNLSQFTGTADLIGAFHQIRDAALKGDVPVAFWDEFDSQNYRWLQYLLAPMQDGVFQEGPLTHPIGRCIFVLAGATSATYDAFGPIDPSRFDISSLHSDEIRAIEDQWREFVLKKGPDFKSRLVAYLNVLGPNQRQIWEVKNARRVWKPDPADHCCPIRRAFFIRGQFKLKDSDELKIDEGVLRALLEVSEYKSGARSLEFLCKELRQSGGIPRRSYLPGRQLLNMHVNASEFWEICERDLPFIKRARELASALHDAYRLHIKGRTDKAHLDRPFGQLNDDMQSANIEQALRIPQNLRLIGLSLEQGPEVKHEHLRASRTVEEHPIREKLQQNIDFLAEAEHNGWMVERMVHGWQYAREPNPGKKLHNMLMPYSSLTEGDKDYDRITIVGRDSPTGDVEKDQYGYVDIVKLVGFRVVMKEQADAVPGNGAP